MAGPEISPIRPTTNLRGRYAVRLLLAAEHGPALPVLRLVDLAAGVALGEHGLAGLPRRDPPPIGLLAKVVRWHGAGA